MGLVYQVDNEFYLKCPLRHSECQFLIATGGFIGLLLPSLFVIGLFNATILIYIAVRVLPVQSYINGLLFVSTICDLCCINLNFFRKIRYTLDCIAHLHFAHSIISDSLNTIRFRLTRLGILTQIVVWHTTSTAIVRLFKAWVNCKMQLFLYNVEHHSNSANVCVTMSYLSGLIDLADWLEVATIVTYSGYFILWLPEVRNRALDLISWLLCHSQTANEFLHLGKLSLSLQSFFISHATKLRAGKYVFDMQFYQTLTMLIDEMPKSYARNAIIWLKKRTDLPPELHHTVSLLEANILAAVYVKLSP
ncbi:unnamed protein product [Echinostoma caproni]|uniref:G protein-coupled receptor n=1 Tax=Echinostoma caproni TaxID=27848 RepID=A0A183ALS5_9TREM|nr:unnamed protein product [Echinostoma caproni]